MRSLWTFFVALAHAPLTHACELPALGSTVTWGGRTYEVQAPSEPYTTNEIALVERGSSVPRIAGCVGNLAYGRNVYPGTQGQSLTIARSPHATIEDLITSTQAFTVEAICFLNGARYDCSVTSTLVPTTEKEPAQDLWLSLHEDGRTELCFGAAIGYEAKRIQVADHSWRKLSGCAFEEKVSVLTDLSAPAQKFEVVYENSRNADDRSRDILVSSDTTGWQEGVDFANHLRRDELPKIKGWRPPERGQESLATICALLCGEWRSRVDRNFPESHDLSLALKNGALTGTQRWRSDGRAHIETIRFDETGGHVFTVTATLDLQPPMVGTVVFNGRYLEIHWKESDRTVFFQGQTPSGEKDPDHLIEMDYFGPGWDVGDPPPEPPGKDFDRFVQ